MAGFQMQPAQLPSGGFPEGYERDPGSDQTYYRGTPVTWDTSSQELDEHALVTVVTNILGVSAEGVVAGVAENPSDMVNVYLATRTTIFMAKLTDSSGDVVTADTANINVPYGLLKTGSGTSAVFSVDEDDTGTPVVEVIGIDTYRNIVYFKFMETAIQQI